MPGRELGGSVEASESPGLGNLKAHKSLPRRRLATLDDIEQKNLKRVRQTRQADAAAYSTNERIKSWIPEPAPIRVVPVLGHPLTPPLNFRDNFKSWIDDAVLRERDFSGSNNIIGDTNLLSQNSPPTPEKTPPKDISGAAGHTSASPSRNAPDSRTESFRTACEDFSLDGRGETPDSQFKQSSQRSLLEHVGHAKQENIGLGLGLESEDDEPTPRRMSPERGARNEDFVAFNGVWGGSTPHRIQQQLHKSERIRRNSATPPVELKLSPAVPHDNAGAVTDTGRSSSLRERVKLQRDSPTSVSTESFAEKIHWPLKDGIKNLDAEFEGVDGKRISQASTASTVVTAMVYDGPLQRRQTLRHTGRIIDPNAQEFAPSRSHRGSISSTYPPLRRRNQNLHYPDVNLRRNFSAASQPRNATHERSSTIPLVVIPDRRSSLQSSTDSSKRLSKTFSAASPSSRPTTAPEEPVSYFDVPQQDHRRTISVVIQQPRHLKRDERVPQELTSPSTATSPPSAPLSKALSPTTSATSGGLRTQRITPTLSVQQSANLSEIEGFNTNENNADTAYTGDWSVSRRRSNIATPFSLRSAHSSTPGTLEVNEATALSIYPHTNKSILVIQEIASKDKSQPREQSTIIAGNASIAIPGTFTPVIHQEPAPRTIADSSLQDQRDPPPPPELIKIIPPTPANAPRSSEESRRAHANTRDKRMSAPLTAMRRAFSARRYSDVIKAPLSRSISQRYSNGRRRFSLDGGDEKENRLHPSWRPRRRFYDGEFDSDSESEFGNDGVLVPEPHANQTRPSRTMSLSNRITGTLRSASLRRPRRSSSVSAAYVPNTQPLPYEVVDDAIKRSQPLARRLTGSLRLKRPSQAQSKRQSWPDQPSYDFVRTDGRSPVDVKRHSVPAQGYQVQFVGFRGVLDKLEKRREMREEDRREARREWLRGRIGVVEADSDQEAVIDDNPSRGGGSGGWS